MKLADPDGKNGLRSTGIDQTVQQSQDSETVCPNAPEMPNLTILPQKMGNTPKCVAPTRGAENKFDPDRPRRRPLGGDL